MRRFEPEHRSTHRDRLATLCSLMRSLVQFSLRLRGSSLLITALILVVLKLWLVAAQPVVAHANASFDDRLYLALAEQVIKGFTLGAKDLAVTYRVMLPQIWPRVLNSIRLNLKAIALFLFAGEMIASTDGLAYRIALLQRHMGMDLILPYVLWVALLLFLVDAALRLLIRWMNPWFREIGFERSN